MLYYFKHTFESKFHGINFLPFCRCLQICLEMLYFANYTGDADSSIIRETWARLIDQALSKGGIGEACSVLKRVGSHMYPGDGAVLPLDTLCLHLEKAALVHFSLYAFLSILYLVCVYGKLVYLIKDYSFCHSQKGEEITRFVFML